MYRKILLYGLPLYLYGLEILLKTFAKVSADSVAGPTLAGAGIGFLLPLTELKSIHLDPHLTQTLASLKATAFWSRDKAFTDFVWLTFFLSLGGWMYSIYLTLQKSTMPQPVNLPLLIGAATFVISVVLAEIKERL